MNSQSLQVGRALVEQWCGEFVRVMQAMGDIQPTMETRSMPPARDSGMLWWNQPLDLAPGAEIWIGTAEETWSAFGRRILAAAGIEPSGPIELKETYLEVLRQSLGVLARVVGSQLGREITAITGTEQEPPADLAFGCQISIGTDGQDLPCLGIYLNQELLQGLQSSPDRDAARSNPFQSTPEDQQDGTEFSARACGTLDLLLDLEMPVSVSFGRTQLRIQNILKLITGSIIELDRSISEPVEVIVNNCTVARGEVVVVDGNYGVRINEVMSRKERLQESRKYLLPASSNRH
jgi:flagellar motor switch protein FliN